MQKFSETIRLVTSKRSLSFSSDCNKQTLLSFFAVLLAYSLFVDDKAETVDKTLLPLDSAIQMKKVDVWQDTIPLTTPLKVISPVARTDAE